MRDQLTPEGSSLGSAPMDLLARFGPRRLASHAAVGLAAWQIAKPWVEKSRAQWRDRRLFTITVLGTDEVYPDLHEWVLSLIPEDERRALVASTGDRGRDSVILEVGVEPPRRRTRLRYDGSRRQAVELDGHRVEVEVEREKMRGSDRMPEEYRLYFESIIFRTRSADGRDAVVRQIDALLEAKHKRPGPPPLRMADRWGSSWDERDDLPPRELSSIILRSGQRERLTEDLGSFLAGEADYNRRCIPWHRGYLFHGPPGTGKTSVVKALANHFRLPLYYLPLGDLKGDNELVSLVSRVRPRSILLLEDVDVFHAATRRDDEAGGVTLSALLNALDGVWTPHGLITVLTTNNREALDEAVVRPGRIDVEEEFALLDGDQSSRMMRWFYRSDLMAPGYARGKSPAALLDAMMRHPDDPAAALASLRG